MAKGTNWTPDGNPIKGLASLAQRAAALERRRADFDKLAEELARKLYAGDISWATWERYMRREIRAMHTAALIYARGGDPKAITPDDLRGLEKTIRGQYGYLKNFSAQARARAFLVETGKGDFFSEKYIATRSKLYGGAPTATFYQTFCYGLLPQVPRDGKTQCKINCRCVLEFKQGKSPEDIFVFWRLMPAEHCDDCVGLAAKWNPYILTLPEGLSASDWVTWLPRLRVHDLDGEHDDEPLAAWDPGQPRDKAGKWTSGVGSMGGLSDATRTAIGNGVADCFSYTQKKKLEAAVLIDGDGNRLGMVKSKNKWEVDYSGIADGTQRIDIHSHPNRSSFSEFDVQNFANGITRHSIVVGADGTIYAMSKPSGWSKFSNASGYNFRQSYSDNKIKFSNEAKRRGIYDADAFEFAGHMAIEVMCRDLGLVYSRIPPEAG